MAADWRLATFNLESLDERSGDPQAFANRVAALRPLLVQVDADVLCLQEVNAQGHGHREPRIFQALDHLLADTHYAGFHRSHSVRPQTQRPSDVHNLVTLSRWPIDRTRQLYHNLVPAWRMPALNFGSTGMDIEISFDRPVLVNEIITPQGTLHLLNMHLRAPRAAPLPQSGHGGHWDSNAEWAKGFYIAALKRQGQALEARLAIDAILDADADARIAVCGDLNAENFETPLRILRGVPDEGGPARLDARALTALELRLPQQRRFSVIHDRRPVLLDHILASRRLAEGCTGVEIYNDNLADEAHVTGPVAGSLHAPLIAKFR